MGGKYRLIDIPLSNCINSNLKILSGDQLYRMDYRDLFHTHQSTGADVTIGGLPIARFQADSLGIMRLDDEARVMGFVERPKTNEQIEPVVMSPDWFRKHGVEARDRDCIANMGIYLFNRDALVDLLREDDCEDFGKQVFPRSVNRLRVQVHMFDGYWEDIGTIGAFYDANLCLARDHSPLPFGLGDLPVYSRPRFLPPARIRGARVTDSLVADGCEIGRNTEIEGSIIGPGCTIGDRVVVRNSVLFGVSIRRGVDGEQSQHHVAGSPAVWVGSGSTIEGAIVDRNALIGRNSRIVNDHDVESSEDADAVMIRDGIPVITKNARLPDGWNLAAH